MKIDSRITGASIQLLKIEHENFALQLGLLEGSKKTVDSKLLKELIYSIDELCWSHNDEKGIATAVQLIALTWEHSAPETRLALREFFVTSLSRLGVSPSTAMIDGLFAKSKVYEALSSFKAEIATVAMQLQFHERIGSRNYYLTSFQKKILDSIANDRLVGISAPTSAGKSFAIYLAAVRFAIGATSTTHIVYLVPTLSLVNQVCSDFRALVEDLRLQRVSVSSQVTSDALVNICVLTQERGIGCLDTLLATNEIGMLIVDEVQNLERVGNDEELRSKILLDLLKDLSERESINRIVLSGPRLENIGEVARIVFGGSCRELQAGSSPVTNLTYSVGKSSVGLYLRQHTSLLQRAPQIRVATDMPAATLGKSNYDEAFHGYLAYLMRNLGSDSQNIVFAPTALQSRRTALALSSLLDNALPGSESLASYLSMSVHPDYDLVHTVNRSVAFHNGSVPPHARLAVEQAFGDGIIQNIVCTTTLMQGVNLPANVVLIRSPKLYVRRSTSHDNAELSSYEFANLRGRAGRLLRDFVGRTVVLDESSFSEDDDSDQPDLFSNDHKSLSPGYRSLFLDHKQAVEKELDHPGTIVAPGPKFVATRIRQAVLRHGVGAYRRLRDVGIEVTVDQLKSVSESLKAVRVGRQVCLKNRYWDPFDLQALHDNWISSGRKAMPSTVWEEKDLTTELVFWLEFQATVSPTYFSRYLGDLSGDKQIFALAKSAERWCRETPLRKIIEGRHFGPNSQDKIDQQIAMIYKHVVYGVSAILKPLADLQERGDALVAAIEHGSYHEVTRELIELGLHRETAVHLKTKLFPKLKGSTPNLRSVILSELVGKLEDLDYWTKRQVAPLVANRRSAGSELELEDATSN